MGPTCQQTSSQKPSRKPQSEVPVGGNTLGRKRQHRKHQRRKHLSEAPLSNTSRRHLSEAPLGQKRLSEAPASEPPVGRSTKSEAQSEETPVKRTSRKPQSEAGSLTLRSETAARQLCSPTPPQFDSPILQPNTAARMQPESSLASPQPDSAFAARCFRSLTFPQPDVSAVRSLHGSIARHCSPTLRPNTTARMQPDFSRAPPQPDRTSVSRHLRSPRPNSYSQIKSRAWVHRLDVGSTDRSTGMNLKKWLQYDYFLSSTYQSLCHHRDLLRGSILSFLVTFCIKTTAWLAVESQPAFR
ncbi:hypothetical protein BJ508DRAFT_305863 [Ascobolus immersus RN42]|uniref:Uncharacterized protein n=1 Tax=Ascobolus immersus RN42 TaxID=1160509 RepID=A0A3N4IKQ5_ASCIM|nr:hypothetical protein BJ508DRAFT_305863 [Ascobolus immersus RN42]